MVTLGKSTFQIGKLLVSTTVMIGVDSYLSYINFIKVIANNANPTQMQDQISAVTNFRKALNALTLQS